MKTKTKRGSFLTNLALLAASTVITLLLCELLLRVLGFGPLYTSPERDRYWKYDSLLGWAHQPGQEGVFETPQFRTSVHINSKGLRDEEHTYERNGETPRILVLGDSFTWGYGVEEPERFSEWLEKSLGAEVINAGVSGYSTDQELLWMQTEGTKYDIDLIILVFAGNDIGDNLRQIVNTIYYKPQFIEKDGDLVLTGNPVPRASVKERTLYFASQRSALVFFLVQRWFDLQLSYNKLKSNEDNLEATDQREPQSSTGIAAVESGPEEPFELTIDLLDEIRNFAVAKEAGFIIVATDRWWNHPSGAAYSDFITSLEAHEFLVLDVEAMSGFDPEQMDIADDGHWNKLGHEFVAEKIGEAIADHHLLPNQ